MSSPRSILRCISSVPLRAPSSINPSAGKNVDNQPPQLSAFVSRSSMSLHDSEHGLRCFRCWAKKKKKVSTICWQDIWMLLELPHAMDHCPAEMLGDLLHGHICLLSSSRVHRELTKYATHHFATCPTRNVPNTPIFQQGMIQGEFDSSKTWINTEV